MTKSPTITAKWSTAAKLALSFSVLIAIVSVVDWFALWQISRANLDLDSMVDASWDRVQSARQAQLFSSVNSRTILEVFTTSDPREIKVLLSQAAANSREISQLLETLRNEAQSSAELALLDDIQSKRETYLATYAHALDLLLKNRRPEEARAVMMHEAAPRLAAYHQALNEYVQYQGRSLEQAQAANIRANAAARRRALLLISCATLLALAIAVFMTWCIARQMSRRLRAEEDLRVAHRDLETKVVARTAELLEVNRRLQSEATERELVERALRQSEQRHRHIVDCASDTIYRTDLEGHFTFVNPSAAALVKRTADECLSIHFLELIREDFRPAAARFYRDQVANQTLVTYFEFPAVAKDQSEVWIGQNVQLVIEDGVVSELQGIARDITARKQIEQQLSDSEQRYRLLFEANPLPMWVFDLNNLAFLAVNDAAVRHYGYSRDEFLAMTITDIRPEEDVPALLDRRNSDAGLFGNVPGAWRHRKKDGGVIDVEVSWHTLEFMGHPAKLVLANDVTKRRLAEVEKERLNAQFENERTRLNNIIANLPGVVWESRPNRDGALRTTFVSDYVEKMLGYTAEEWLSLPGGWFSAVHPDDKDRLAEEMARKEDVTEFRWIARDGRVVHGESRAALIYDESGQFVGVRGVTLDTSERKRAESEILLQTARFHQLFENTPMGIVMVDEHDVVINVNAEFERMFQFSQSELKGRPINDSIVPSDYAEEAAELSVRTFRREIVQKEGIRRRKDGSLLPVEIYGVPIIANDRLVGVFAIYIDLTEQRRLELERQIVLDIIHGAISTADLDDLFKLIHTSISKVLYAENCFVALHDPDADLLHYEFWVDKHDPVPRPRPIGVGFGSYVLQTGKPLLLTEEMTSEMITAGIVKSSGTFSPSWLGVPLRTASRVIGVLVVQHYEAKDAYNEADLQFLESVGSQVAMAIERKRSEQALFKANKRALEDYESLLERIASLGQTLGTARDLTIIFRALRNFATVSVPCDGMVISLYDRDKSMRRAAYCWADDQEFDPANLSEVPVRDGLTGRAIKSGAVIIQNDFQKEVSRLATAVTIGDCDENNLPRSALSAPMSVMGRIVGCVEIQSYQLNAFRQEHATAMRMAANLAANAIENVVLIEREQEKEEQLRQAQKMESIGTLAGGIAHDFNNLMTAVTGYSDLALRGDLEDALRTKIEEIKKAGERASSLTRQLLAFSRKQMLQPKVLDLNEVATGMIKMLPRLIGEHIAVSFKLDQSLGRIKADPGQIEQVILNLAVNGRDAMPHGGCLTIETLNVHFSERFNNHPSAIEPGNYVMLAVSDTGCGMDAETQAHIYEPFFTTKEVGKGTGLGLSTVYGIVNQSGGTIWLYSEPEKGTTFKIYLPRVDEVETPTIAIEVPAVPGGKETVLLVEDEEQVRNLSKEILEAYGYSVLVAPNGAEGMRIGKEFEGRIDLVLSDVIMPQMSGRELIDRLKAVRPESKVLYMSGFTDDAIIHHGVLDEGVFFLQKPFSTEVLASKVREVLDQ